MQTILFDIETTAIGKNGELPDTIHVIKAHDYEADKRYSFRGDKINDAIKLFNSADRVVAHFGLGFDFAVLRKLYSEYAPNEEVDSLVLAYMFEGDIKETTDYARVESDKKLAGWHPHKFPGNLIGAQGIEAWGMRFGVPKGTYAKDMETKGLDPWATWNIEMDKYCDIDVDILVLLWKRLIERGCDSADFRQAIMLEHDIQDLMLQLKNTGIFFDQAKAEDLLKDIERNRPQVLFQIQEAFPPRIEPVKWVSIPARRSKKTVEKAMRNNTSEMKRAVAALRPLKDKFTAASKARKPFMAYGDVGKMKRKTDEFVEIERVYELRCDRYFPQQRKVNQLEADAIKLQDELNEINNDGDNVSAHLVGFEDREQVPPNVGAVTVYKRSTYRKASKTYITGGAPFCKIILREFKPSSRVQIIRRLRGWDHEGWQPELWTDKGNPKINADVLGSIVGRFPVAKPLEKFFLLEKRISQIKTGEKSWFNSVRDDGLIHPRINPCATVTHRATHSDPNMSQVPALLFGKEGVLFGEEGEWGYECRACFGPPPPSYTGGVQWVQVGTDLSGLELRCFGHYLYEFDQGAFIEILMNEDVHGNNQRIMELDNRTDAKRVIFALLYGGGNKVIGAIVKPLATVDEQVAEGQRIRSRLLAGIKGFAELTAKIQAAATYNRKLEIIDGRTVPVRNAYAALNTKLQASGSILAKAWIIETIVTLEQEYGLRMGYDHDYTLLLWSHDEMQFACHPDHAQLIKRVAEESSIRAGESLDFKPKLEAESKIGKHWAECH